MREQIYINGVLMDLLEGKTNSLVFQSMFFTDIESIVSNRSNSMDFPTTPNNLKAIDNSHLSSFHSTYPYSKHKVQYFLDGLQLFSGYGILMAVTPTSIKFTFTWGNVNAFKTMLDIKLRSLPEEYVEWSYNAMISSSKPYDRNLWFSSYGNHTIVAGNIQLLCHPYQTVEKLLNKIETASGVTIEGKDRFSKYAIPCVTKMSDGASRRTNSVHVTHQTTSKVWKSADTYYGVVDVLSSEDPRGWEIGDYGFLNVSNVNRIGIFCPVGGLHFAPGTGGYANFSVLSADDEDGVNSKAIYQGGSWDADLRSQGEYKLKKEVNITLDVTGVNFVAIRLTWGSQSAAAITWKANPDLYIYDVDDENVEYKGLFPLQLNMPDWSASQLLKNLMKMEGLFAHCPNDRTIRFVSIDDLFSNRENALDWTGKIKLQKGIVTEQSSRFMSFAQRNRCSYQEDDTNTQKHEGYLRVEDATLDPETDFMTLDFAGTDKRYGNNNVVAGYVINAYKVTVGEDNSKTVEFQEVKPRIMEIVTDSDDRPALSFANIDMPEILATKYNTYQQVIERPRVLKATVRMNAMDLAALDLTIPVFSFELGHYYAITKLTAKSDGTADAELLQLGYRLVSEEDVPDTISDLTVVYDAVTDNAFADIPSLSEGQKAKVIGDPRYRIFIMRQGYTRRGKYLKYRWSGKPEKDVSTHTDRNNFRRWRGGDKWRIMAHECMYNGEMTGQAAKVYEGYTLVFGLGDSIALPRNKNTFRHRNKSKAPAGTPIRLQNPASSGLVELHMAMYRNDNGRWKKISNIVQVRGRSEDKTEAWEFIESNVVFSTRG